MRVTCNPDLVVEHPGEDGRAWSRGGSATGIDGAIGRDGLLPFVKAGRRMVIARENKY